jgi:hypothetical protein
LGAHVDHTEAHNADCPPARRRAMDLSVRRHGLQPPADYHANAVQLAAGVLVAVRSQTLKVRGQIDSNCRFCGLKSTHRTRLPWHSGTSRSCMSRIW